MKKGGTARDLFSARSLVPVYSTGFLRRMVLVVQYLLIGACAILK
jgi:hypothetical protein